MGNPVSPRCKTRFSVQLLRISRGAVGAPNCASEGWAFTTNAATSRAVAGWRGMAPRDKDRDHTTSPNSAKEGGIGKRDGNVRVQAALVSSAAIRGSLWLTTRL